MKGKAKVELIMSGLGEVVRPMVEETTSTIALRAGEGYSHAVAQGRTRPHGRVWTETDEAMKDNQETNRLLKSMYGG